VEVGSEGKAMGGTWWPAPRHQHRARFSTASPNIVRGCAMTTEDPNNLTYCSTSGIGGNSRRRGCDVDPSGIGGEDINGVQLLEI
jgi:hypothetical protein